MSDFNVIKENLPKVDFKAKKKIEESLRSILIDNEKFFKISDYSYLEYIEVDEITDNEIEISGVGCLCSMGYQDCENFCIRIPIRAITDEKEFEKYVKEKEEEELRLKAEKEAAEKAKKEKEKQKAAEREYNNYLRLKAKYESNGE